MLPRVDKAHTMLKTAHRRGFSLIELMTVVVLVLVLAAVLLSTVNMGVRSAQQSRCLSNLRQLYTAVQLFAQDNDDLLPTAYLSSGGTWQKVLKDRYIADEQLFYCPSAEYDPLFNSNQVSYGYNLDISAKQAPAAPSVRRSSLAYPEMLILIGDSVDTGKQQYFIAKETNGSVRAGPRHGGQIQLVHADGSVSRKQPSEVVDDRYWRPYRLGQL